MQRNSTIGELMERKRIQDGAKEYQGHTYMDLARFDDATKHMIIFDVLTDESPVGWKGERMQYQDYQPCRSCQGQSVLRPQRYGTIICSLYCLQEVMNHAGRS
mgnify:CR=1 FL=1